MGSASWRSNVTLYGNLWGGVTDHNGNRLQGSGAISLTLRELLVRKLDALRGYEQVIVTRSDHFHMCSHPRVVATRSPDPSSGGLLPRAPSTLRELVDPTRDAAMMAGAYAGPPTEYAEEDPDGALRRAICPRNPTADVCRSAKDRKRVNDSPCKVPLLNACLVWKEGKGNEQIVLRGRRK